MRGMESSVPALAFEADSLSDKRVLPIDEVTSAYYLRIPALDRAGVLANITQILGKQEINIEAIIQKDPREDTQVVEVIILTHQVKERTMNQAITQIEALDAITGKVVRIRVADLDD
jgi:homoserine dehydrogenase